MRCAECHQPPQFRRQGQAGTFGLHHQQCWQVQRVGQVPGAGGITGAAQAIVIAHGPLHHRRAMACRILGIQAAHRGRGGEKQVKVVAFYIQHGAVEHRVDIIRPRFEGTGMCAPRLQRRQQGTGGGRFAAAGARRGQDELQHVTPSQLRIPGCLPLTNAGCPPLCCG